METIRQRMRFRTDTKRIKSFLVSSRLGVLGLNGGEYPFAVPMNYIWLDGRVYFNGVGAGRRARLLHDEPPVRFTVYAEYGSLGVEKAWYERAPAYFSVSLFGRVRKLTRAAEAEFIMRLLADKYMSSGRDRLDFVDAPFLSPYRADAAAPLSVYSIKPAWASAKQKPSAPEELFLPGKTGDAL
jgi:nitroimidazol reductase NimA-like FMN-containing flavoprotein (pyridoxamine 5'-phosphate oxidase superfamily)